MLTIPHWFFFCNWLYWIWKGLIMVTYWGWYWETIRFPIPVIDGLKHGYYFHVLLFKIPESGWLLGELNHPEISIIIFPCLGTNAWNCITYMPLSLPDVGVPYKIPDYWCGTGTKVACQALQSLSVFMIILTIAMITSAHYQMNTIMTHLTGWSSVTKVWRLTA